MPPEDALRALTVRSASCTLPAGIEGSSATRPHESPQATRSWFSLRSLRGKLQLFALLLIVVPGTLLALIAYQDARAALERAVGRQLVEVAHDGRGEIADAVADAQNGLHAWARQDVMRDVVIGDLDKRVSRALRSLTDDGAPFRELVCVDRDGRVVAASDPRRLGDDWGGRESVRAAREGRDFLAVSPARANGDAATVEMATPLPPPDGGDAAVGVLVGRYDWGRAMARLDRIRRDLLPHGLTLDFVVLDATGAVVGSTNDSPLDVPAVATGQRGWRQVPSAGVLLG